MVEKMSIMTMRRLILAMALISLMVLVAPLSAQQPSTVQSIPIEKMDDIIRRSGDCLMVVMAAWCYPCIEELPALKALDQKYRREGLRIVGLSLDYGGPQAMQPILAQHKIRFPVYWTGEAAIEKYAITKIPLLVFFRDGRVVKRLQGQRDKATLEKEIVGFLKGT